MNKVDIYEAILDIAKRLLKDKIGTMDNQSLVKYSAVSLEINNLIEGAKSESFGVAENAQNTTYLPSYQQ